LREIVSGSSKFRALSETGLSGAVLYHLFSHTQAHADDDELRMTLSSRLRVVIVHDDPPMRGVMLYMSTTTSRRRPADDAHVNLCVGASNAGFKDLLIEKLTTRG
jgi:hypothetical protein